MGSRPEARRVTWMVAFWRDIAIRPFAPDGLPGSSRPLPDCNEPMHLGGRTYTWQQKLRVQSSGQSALASTASSASPAEVPPLPVACVWEKVGRASAERLPAAVAAAGTAVGAALESSSEHVPEYSKCFQF